MDHKEENNANILAGELMIKYWELNLLACAVPLATLISQLRSLSSLQSASVRIFSTVVVTGLSLASLLAAGFLMFLRLWVVRRKVFAEDRAVS
ncbi:MAG: hypothetical protein AAGJ92_13300, partial [Pseudomonadota bacterium]